MTLIIGVKCEDGIVLGADGAIADISIRMGGKKLSPILNSGMIGHAGPTGLGQRLTEALESGLKLNTPKELLKNCIQDIYYAVIQNDWKIINEAKVVYGEQVVNSITSLMALYFHDEFRLINIGACCEIYEITFEIPIFCIGSGKFNADSFLAFIWRVIWSGKIPKISDALLGVYWTIDHSIKITPGGIAEPIQMMLMNKENGNLNFEEFYKENTADFEEGVRDFENHIKNYFKVITEIEEEPSPEKIILKNKIIKEPISSSDSNF